MIDPRKIRPPHIVFVLYLMAGAVHFFVKLERVVPPVYHVPGAIMFLAGLGFMSWAYRLFVKHGTPVKHSEVPCKFVTEGPYRWTRNPMYVGGIVMFFGIALLIGSWPFLVVPVVLFYILDKIYIPWEERIMEELFKDEYKEYFKKTQRWV